MADPPAAIATLFEALGGLVIGTVAGVVVAVLTARFLTARELAAAARDRRECRPDHRLRPADEQLVRGADPLSKMMMVAVLVFFPVVVNVTRG